MYSQDMFIMVQEGMPASQCRLIDAEKVQDYIWQRFNNRSAPLVRPGHCALCDEIFGDNGFSTSSYWRLAISAKLGCQMCSAINAAVLEFLFPLWAGNPWFIPFAPQFILDINRDRHIEGLNIGPETISSLLRDSDDARIEMFSTRTDSPYSPLGRGISDEVTEQLDLEACLEFLRPCLRKCESSHDLCKPEETPSQDRPARFLFIDADTEPPVVRVVDGAHVKRPYIALSHCWGGKEGMVETTSKSIKKHRYPGIPLPDLPKTFVDAVNISHGLGIKHIWIDSLCIVQDDKVDWEQESVKMAAIYSGAYLTIAATGSLNPSGGCFFSRHYSFNASKTISYSEMKSRVESLGFLPEFEVRYRRTCHDHFRVVDRIFRNGDETQAAPLFTRAWAFQERILSKRLIHFHSEEMIWECNEHRACECGRLRPHDYRSIRGQVVAKAILSQASSGKMEHPDLWRIWKEFVKTYFRLKMTFETDRLPGIAGLAKYFSRTMNCTYMAGLWKEDLPTQLLWVRYPGYQKRDRTHCVRVPGVPTWSWASVALVPRMGIRSGWIEFQFDLLAGHKEHPPHAEFQVVVDESSWRESRSYTVPPNNGRLEIEGLVFPFKLSVLDREGEQYKMTPMHGTVEKAWEQWRVYLDVSEGPEYLFESEESEVEVVCLLVHSTRTFITDPLAESNGGYRLEWFLVLREVDRLEGVFQRVGVAVGQHLEAGSHWRDRTDFQGVDCAELTLE